MTASTPRRPVVVAALLLHLLLLAGQTCPARAHGFLDWPNPRGALHHNLATVDVDKDAPFDPYLHFPAGSKAHWPGAGKRSQEVAAGGKWTPFEPLRRGFRWRAGVCGDPLQKRDHLRGGKYYFNARPVATFQPGGVIDASIKVVAHHNGFVELHLCDVARCGGDITPACFANGHCVQLRRARNRLCDGGTSRACGPVDRKYPGRWYLPCSANNDDRRWERFGPGSMKFQIPNGYTCEKCVLHWFWSSANGCNPPGVIEYFDGPDRPKNWGNCPGQSGARGGVTRVQKDCGGKVFAEEYYQCADVVVRPGPVGGRYDVDLASQTCTKDTCRGPNPNPKPKPEAKPKPKQEASARPAKPAQDAPKLTKLSASRDRNGGMSEIRGLRVVSRGRALGALYNGDVVDGATLPDLTFEAVTEASVRSVRFELSAGGRRWRTVERARPFRMFAGWKTRFWKDVVYNKVVTIKVSSDGDTDVFRVRFVKKVP